MSAAPSPPPAQKLVMLYKKRGEVVIPFVGYWNDAAQVYLDALRREQHADVISWKFLESELEAEMTTSRRKSWFYRHIAPSFCEPITWGDLVVLVIVIKAIEAFA